MRSGAFVQRFGSALQLNVHFHVLVPEGLFAAPSPGTSTRATFLPLPPPTDDEVEALLRTVMHRVVDSSIPPLSNPPAPTAPPRHDRLPWAELLRRTFELDGLTCLKCGGHRRVLAYITAPRVVRAILDHLGLPSRALPLARRVTRPRPASSQLSAPDCCCFSRLFAIHEW